MAKLKYDGPIVLAILDGVGLAPSGKGNAVSQANLPFLSQAVKKYPHLAIGASGEYVGLPAGQIGNSEVGHNTIGSGQNLKHSIAHIDEAFENGSIWQSQTWQDIKKRIKKNPAATIHLAGIFSDGGVHSHIKHLEWLIEKAYDEGARRFRIHCVFDGRDVAPQSEPKYIEQLETFAYRFPMTDIKIASGGGRMVTVADRYSENWKMVADGWNMIVNGKSKSKFHSAAEAIKQFRSEKPKIQDQFLPPFVVVDAKNQPIGKVADGDTVIYFDFRADRAVEIAQVFDNPEKFSFTHYNHRKKYYFAGLTEYNIEKHIPKHVLVPPINFQNTLHEFLAEKGISQFAVSETVKYGHITYYFNGNSYQKAKKEVFHEVKNPNQDFQKNPKMAAKEIADEVIKNLDKFQFLRCNFANGDMVGHYAEPKSTIRALETIDAELSRIAKKVDELGGCLIITADHGNAEEILDKKGNPKTAHTTNPVPLIFYDNTENRKHYTYNKELSNPGLANIAATISMLLGEKNYPKSWQNPLIMLK